MKKKLLFVAAGMVALGVAGCAALQLFSEARPTGTSGPAADALAREVQQAVGIEGWQRSMAVRIRIRDERPEHLWDRARSLLRVDFGDTQVYLRTADRTGVVIKDGKPVADPAKDLERGWSAFINDVFWTYPFDSFFHEGVTRSVVEVEGGRGLLVEYGSGGVTPGDAYLWIVDDKGTPLAWKLWVHVLPGGVRFGWSDWREQATGVRIPFTRETAVGGFTIQAEVATTLAELVPGQDPFAPLFAEPGAASQPGS